MPRPRKSLPSYLPHGTSDRARAIWTDQTGHRHFRLLPGPFNSPASRAAFHKLGLEIETSALQQLAASGTTAAATVADVLLAYWLFADKHYRAPDGKSTSEIHEVKIVIKSIRELYAETPVAEFGPLCVRAARQQWVKDKCSRSECNRRLGVVKRILKWAVSMQLVPVTIYQAAVTVTGLQRGRTEAHEVLPVGPVDDAVVDATLPFLNRHIRGLIELQRLTGCRPGEACAIRRSEIDTCGDTWLYRPTIHKNSWRGKPRVIAIGPKAKALLREFFTANIEAFLFSPRLAMEEARTAAANGELRPKLKRMVNERYDRTAYTRAVARAALAARVQHWHPNQLRHTHATKVRKQFGLEHAGAARGHSKMSATEVYAERDAGLAVEVAIKLG